MTSRAQKTTAASTSRAEECTSSITDYAATATSSAGTLTSLAPAGATSTSTGGGATAPSAASPATSSSATGTSAGGTASASSPLTISGSPAASSDAVSTTTRKRRRRTVQRGKKKPKTSPPPPPPTPAPEAAALVGAAQYLTVTRNHLTPETAAGLHTAAFADGTCNTAILNSKAQAAVGTAVPPGVLSKTPVVVLPAALSAGVLPAVKDVARARRANTVTCKVNASVFGVVAGAGRLVEVDVVVKAGDEMKTIVAHQHAYLRPGDAVRLVKPDGVHGITMHVTIRSLDATVSWIDLLAVSSISMA